VDGGVFGTSGDTQTCIFATWDPILTCLEDGVTEKNLDALHNEVVSLRAALYDTNTRLPAYASCFEQLTQLTQNRYLGIVYLQFSDLDRLEAIYGFQHYEEVLSRVARQLQACNAREYDNVLLLTQRGVYDDQFCVFVPYDLLSHSPVPSLEKVARRIYSVLDSELTVLSIQGLSIHLGYSVLHYNPFLRFERSVHRAVEEAAAIAQRQEETDRILHEVELRHIISRQQLTTLYHPIVHMKSLEAMGYEALTRGPSGTPYENPEALFSYARLSKLGRELDRECKLTAIASARGKPPGTRLFINTLPSTLDDPEFLDGKALQNLEELGMCPSDVVWELTERHAIEDFETFGTLMKAHTALGFGVAIDDVGTGFSSIQTITHVRPLFLKIDISLVKGIEENLLKQELVLSLLALGNNIRAEVIAEGIETVREMETLKELGIGLGQGFLFGRPAPKFPMQISLPA
jgi:EAL domain-containing protein (putative c-di-GMP-specific phosphodiesterase class I)